MSDIRKYINLMESAIHDSELLESFKVAAEKFAKEEDLKVVNEYIKTFKDLSKRNIITGEDKDISKWIKLGWEEFRQFVDESKNKKSGKQNTKIKKKDSIVVADDNSLYVVIPLSMNSSIYYGKGTKWCTSSIDPSDNQFDRYFFHQDKVMIYIITRPNQDKYAVSLDVNNGKCQFFDELDNRLGQRDFEAKTGITKSLVKQWYERHKSDITKKQFQWINGVDEGEQVMHMKSNPSYFYAINKPSPKVVRAATVLMGHKQGEIDKIISHLGGINKIPFDIQLELVMRDPSISSKIKPSNPDEEKKLNRMVGAITPVKFGIDAHGLGYENNVETVGHLEATNVIVNGTVYLVGIDSDNNVKIGEYNSGDLEDIDSYNMSGFTISPRCAKAIIYVMFQVADKGPKAPEVIISKDILGNNFEILNEYLPEKYTMLTHTGPYSMKEKTDRYSRFSR